MTSPVPIGPVDRPGPTVAGLLVARSLAASPDPLTPGARPVQPRLQQHHGRRAVDDRARGPALAAGRRQRPLRLDRGEALIGRLDRDAQRLERSGAARPPRASAAWAAGPLAPERLRGRPTTTVRASISSITATTAAWSRAGSPLRSTMPQGDARVRRLSL